MWLLGREVGEEGTKLATSWGRFRIFILIGRRKRGRRPRSRRSREKENENYNLKGGEWVEPTKQSG